MSDEPENFAKEITDTQKRITRVVIEEGAKVLVEKHGWKIPAVTDWIHETVKRAAEVISKKDE